MSRQTQTVITEIDLTGEGLTYPRGPHLVEVHTVQVFFVNGQFKDLALDGRIEGGPAVKKWFNKIRDMPEWAIPWTVYQAHQVFEPKQRA